MNKKRFPLFNVYSSKKVAELAPGVGQATSMKIVTRDKTETIGQDVINELDKMFEIDKNSEPNYNSIMKDSNKQSQSKKG